MSDHQKRMTRRNTIKRIGAIGASAAGATIFAPTARADPEGPGKNANTPPSGGGGSGIRHTLWRQADSNYWDGQSGTSYTGAGSAHDQISDKIHWDNGIWWVRRHVWACAGTGYELENGDQGKEALFRSQHRIIINTEYEDQVSTQPYDDVNWGVSRVTDYNTDLDPTGEVVSTAGNIIAGWGSFLPNLYDAIDLYNRLEQDYVDGEIDKTWLLEPSGQTRMGHYLMYTHTFPTREVLGTDSFDVTITNRLQNALYKPSTDWTGDREPTDEYDHTFEYSQYIPPTP